MKILIISDLHLCDKRNSVEFEQNRMLKLADFIRSSGVGAVLDLGDAVSRKELLRDNFADGIEAMKYYLDWRSQFTIPFIECAVAREFEFFEKLTGQKPDSFHTFSNMSVITLAPKEANDHRLTTEQLDFLISALKKADTPNILIASHVPYPGSCSREIAPGIFLEVSQELKDAVEKSDENIFWCGGHFHWQEEPPAKFGSLTAFYGGRFCFENSPERNGYLRAIDTDTGEISTILPSFWW